MVVIHEQSPFVLWLKLLRRSFFEVKGDCFFQFIRVSGAFRASGAERGQIGGGIRFEEKAIETGDASFYASPPGKVVGTQSAGAQMAAEAFEAYFSMRGKITFF